MQLGPCTTASGQAAQCPGMGEFRCPRRRLLALVERQHLAHVTLASHDDGAPVMDVLGHHIEDAPDLAEVEASRGDAAGLLRDHCHGEALVEDAQLAFLGLLVCRVEEDAAIEQCAVHIGDHGANIPSCEAIALAVLHEVLDGLVPGVEVPFVAGVDLLAATLGQLHGLHEEELPYGDVEGESVHALAVGDHELSGRAEHAVARRDALRARAEDVVELRGAVSRALAAVDREDGAHTHIAVDVGGTVQGVEGAAEGPTLVGILDDDGLFVLLAHQQ
mmetsp:Transcript_70654/g.160470  ORF Transcript_70654/g.160470 Transcript_70654/m.160470 type:complete len:276 (+) Transcript_70654:40-867(+)